MNTILTSFVYETAAKVPLSGTYFEADHNTVHRTTISFTAAAAGGEGVREIGLKRLRTSETVSVLCKPYGAIFWMREM